MCQILNGSQNFQLYLLLVGFENTIRNGASVSAGR